MGEPTSFNSEVSRSSTSRSETKGSEPSQYLKEKKTNAIPGVAASEMGRA